MKPWNTLAAERTPDGDELLLQERDGVYAIRVGGQELMSSARHGSEESMAGAGLDGLSASAPAVLIGGVGLGYTVRATLERLPAKGSVVVAEIVPAVVDWVRGPLSKLAGAPLDDPRVSVEVGDIGRFAARTRQRFDAILLDVDNGPSALFRRGNQQLYGRAGVAAFRNLLRPGGRLVVWSAGSDERFLAQLRVAGFEAEERRVAARPGAGARHVLLIGRLPVAGRRGA